MEPAVSGRAEAVQGGAAVTDWTTTRTSADYAPAVRLYPNGQQRRGGAFIPRIVTVEQARAMLATGEIAVVAAGDAGRVKDGESNG